MTLSRNNCIISAISVLPLVITVSCLRHLTRQKKKHLLALSTLDKLQFNPCRTLKGQVRPGVFSYACTYKESNHGTYIKVTVDG